MNNNRKAAVLILVGLILGVTGASAETVYAVRWDGTREMVGDRPVLLTNPAGVSHAYYFDNDAATRSYYDGLAVTSQGPAEFLASDPFLCEEGSEWKCVHSAECNWVNAAWWADVGRAADFGYGRCFSFRYKVEDNVLTVQFRPAVRVTQPQLPMGNQDIRGQYFFFMNLTYGFQDSESLASNWPTTQCTHKEPVGATFRFVDCVWSPSGYLTWTAPPGITDVTLVGTMFQDPMNGQRWRSFPATAFCDNCFS